MGHVAGPPDTADQARRMQRVRAYGVLDTPREPQFDRFVYTAAQMFRVPIALLSIADVDRFWFKASVGVRLLEVERTLSFCQHMGTGTDVLTVEDAQMDGRFVDSPLVTGEPFIRFYAGAPLVTPDGLVVGTLSVIDRYPKTLLPRQVWQLSQLAESVVTALEARRSF